MSDDNATETEVNEAISTLNEAINSLIQKADKTNLITLFNAAYQLQEDQYTSDSYAKVVSLLEDVEALIDNENASQEDVNDMYNQLRQAMDQLEIKESEEIETSPSDEEEIIIPPSDEEEVTTTPSDESQIEISVVPDQSSTTNLSDESVQVATDVAQATKTQDTTSLLSSIILMTIAGLGYFIIKKSSLFQNKNDA